MVDCLIILGLLTCYFLFVFRKLNHVRHAGLVPCVVHLLRLSALLLAAADAKELYRRIMFLADLDKGIQLFNDTDLVR
jgi:hypothetical protein